MKKRLRATTVGAALVALAACGGQEDTQDSSTSPPPADEGSAGTVSLDPVEGNTGANGADVAGSTNPPPGAGLLEGGSPIVLWTDRGTGAKVDYTPPPEELMRGVWVFSQYKKVRIKLDDGTLAGVTGCNNFTGNFTLKDDNAIEFNSIASTKMQCEKRAMAVENFILNGIRTATEFSVTRVQLKFSNGEGQELVFTRSG